LTAAALAPLARERVIPLISKNDAACLALLGELAHAGHIRTVVDRQFALSETADAISHVGAGRARGKVIIAVR
jgi:NADPH:quinone reductase-like Zn-dependent oxidoreductase